MSCRSNFSPTTPRSHAAPTSTSREIWRSPSRWNNLDASQTGRRAMHLRTLAVALAAGGLFSANAQAQTEIQWWHSMTGALGNKLNEIASGFNASQKDYKVVPVYRGSYPESMTAAIAAFRAGNAPHILQRSEEHTSELQSLAYLV